MLTGIMRITQPLATRLFKQTLYSGGNMLLLGPAGCGKTEMGYQAIFETDTHIGLYANLSVMEAPEFLGLPKIYERIINGEPVPFIKYATPDWVPVLDLQELDKDGNPRQKPFCVIFDEVDKAKHDVQAPLLEFLKERSIQGRKLHVGACFLTGNMPDENAYSQPLNHAVTNRCKVYVLEPQFDPWLEWARNNGVNPLIIAYLSRNQNDLLVPPPDGDITAYAHPTPRAWTNAAREIDAHLKSLGDKQLDSGDAEFIEYLVAGFVGVGAASRFKVWLEHYRVLDPMVDSLLEDGQRPPQLELDKMVLFSILSVSRLMKWVKANGAEKGHGAVVEKADNVFNWLSGISTEFQVAAVKTSLDMKTMTDHNMMSIQSVRSLIQSVSMQLTRKY